MSKRNKNINFRTYKQSTSGQTKKFFVIFFSCVLVVLAISCLAILSKYDFNIKSAVSGQAETETTTEVTETAIPEIHADKTYLFWCASDDRQSVHSAWIVNIKMPERELSVCTVAPETKVVFNGGMSSLESVYAQRGENGFVSAVESVAGIKIDGYAGSDEGSFKTMINYFGGVDITVPEQVEYRGGDMTLILIKGKQNMKGDTLFKYLKYLETLGARGSSLQAAAVSEIFEYVFTPSYLNRRSGIFSKFSNTLKTDLSIVDFSSSEEAIKVLMENGFEAIRTDTPFSELISSERDK